MPPPAPPPAPPSPAALARSELAARFGRPLASWRLRVYTILFESETPAARTFDCLLALVILASVLVVFLDSVQSISARYGHLFDVLEWVFTALFTVEYALRLACVQRPVRYARSFFGVVDLLSVLPTYLAFCFPGADSLMNVRLLRLLRIFRILKLGAYVTEFNYLGESIIASRRKITVFIAFILITVMILGTIMYVVEGPRNGFTSIPVSIYWGISTMSTVGFGDITPKTDLGRFIASCMMLMGWGILAVPTGIVTAELTARRMGRPVSLLKCLGCSSEGHEPGARFCKDCGQPLPPTRPD